ADRDGCRPRRAPVRRRPAPAPGADHRRAPGRAGTPAGPGTGRTGHPYRPVCQARSAAVAAPGRSLGWTGRTVQPYRNRAVATQPLAMTAQRLLAPPADEGTAVSLPATGGQATPDPGGPAVLWTTAGAVDNRRCGRRPRLGSPACPRACTRRWSTCSGTVPSWRPSC